MNINASPKTHKPQPATQPPIARDHFGMGQKFRNDVCLALLGTVITLVMIGLLLKTVSSDPRGLIILRESATTWVVSKRQIIVGVDKQEAGSV